MEASNMKAMREALSEIVLLTVKAGKSISCDVACGIIASKAKHALKQPPRNCDAGTVEEQIARFDAECLAIRKRNTVEPCAGCPCSRGGEGTEDCQLRWAQMPYEEEKEGVKRRCQMKIVDGKIVEATRDELIDYFLRHIDAGDSFGAFVLKCKDNGIKIIKEGGAK